MPRNKLAKNPADYIVPLNINGLEGRMMRLSGPVKRQREILYIYGHHAMLERWWGFVENLAEYGNVTVPDLPGFGGMDSFYKIGKKPTIDNFADYLAAFIKLRYRRKRVTIFALSFGFVVVTRMLQKYPELTKKVDLLVSEVGFVHKEDFIYKPATRVFFRWSSALFSMRPMALFIRYAFLNSFMLKFIHARMPNTKRRMVEVTPEEFSDIANFEVKLWQVNDVRTHWYTTKQFFEVDNCGVRVNLPVYHVVSAGDFYFNPHVVEQHMRIVFTDYKSFTTTSKAHTPHVMADKKAMGVLLPPGLKRLLVKDR